MSELKKKKERKFPFISPGSQPKQLFIISVCDYANPDLMLTAPVVKWPNVELCVTCFDTACLILWESATLHDLEGFAFNFPSTHAKHFHNIL